MFNYEVVKIMPQTTVVPLTTRRSTILSSVKHLRSDQYVQRPCYLMRVPKETRIQIYKYVLSKGDVIWTDLRDGLFGGKIPALLHTNKQIRDEAAQVYFRNTFSMKTSSKYDSRHWLHMIGHNVTRITSLRLCSFDSLNIKRIGLRTKKWRVSLPRDAIRAVPYPHGWESAWMAGLEALLCEMANKSADGALDKGCWMRAFAFMDERWMELNGYLP